MKPTNDIAYAEESLTGRRRHKVLISASRASWARVRDRDARPRDQHAGTDRRDRAVQQVRRRGARHAHLGGVRPAHRASRAAGPRRRGPCRHRLQPGDPLRGHGARGPRTAPRPAQHVPARPTTSRRTSSRASTARPPTSCSRAATPSSRPTVAAARAPAAHRGPGAAARGPRGARLRRRLGAHGPRRVLRGVYHEADLLVAQASSPACSTTSSPPCSPRCSRVRLRAAPRAPRRPGPRRARSRGPPTQDRLGQRRRAVLAERRATSSGWARASPAWKTSTSCRTPRPPSPRPPRPSPRGPAARPWVTRWRSSPVTRGRSPRVTSCASCARWRTSASSWRAWPPSPATAAAAEEAAAMLVALRRRPRPPTVTAPRRVGI